MLPMKVSVAMACMMSSYFHMMIGQFVRLLPRYWTSWTCNGLGINRPPPEVARDALDHTVIDAANSMRTRVKPFSRDGPGAFQPGAPGYSRGKGS
jgi:hypothetical protein